MPAIITATGAGALRRGLAADAAFATRSLHTAGNLLLRRDTDNHVAEVAAVIAAVVVIVGFLLYWGITKQGSCDWRARK